MSTPDQVWTTSESRQRGMMAMLRGAGGELSWITDHLTHLIGRAAELGMSADEIAEATGLEVGDVLARGGAPIADAEFRRRIAVAREMYELGDGAL